MNRNTLNTTIACAIALAAGVTAGAMRSPSTTAKAPSTTNPAVEPQPEINEPLARAVKTEMGAKRWLLLVSSAEKATAKDMLGIIRAAGDDYAAVRMLGAHWANLDPKHMFATLYAEMLKPDGAPGTLSQRWTLSESLFEEWIKNDPEAVVKAMNEVPKFSGLDNMRHSVVNSLMKTDVENGLRAMHEWNISNYLPDMKHVAAWAARDPKHAAEVAVKYSRGYASQEALKQIGKVWANSDPEGGMNFAATLEHSARASLGPEIMRSWAAKDLEAAARYTAAQTDIGFRNGLAQGLVSAWAKSDPGAALDWSEENLRGVARTEAISGIVKAAAEKDLTTAGEIVAGMEAGATQNRAAASLFEVWFNKGKDQREAAFEWLAALPDKEARSAAFERVQWNWMWQDPKGVRDFVTGPHGEMASQSMIHQVARNQAGKNPEAAMEWASKLPKDRIADARNAVLENWIQIRPESAANFARKLPSGEERDRAIRTVTQHFSWQAPEQAGTWLRSLSETEQKSALESFPAGSNQRQKLEAAIKQPAK
jgi:hypothetical protein